MGRHLIKQTKLFGWVQRIFNPSTLEKSRALVILGSMGLFEPMNFRKLESNLLLFAEIRVRGSELLTYLDVQEL